MTLQSKARGVSSSARTLPCLVGDRRTQRSKSKPIFLGCSAAFLPLPPKSGIIHLERLAQTKARHLSQIWDGETPQKPWTTRSQIPQSRDPAFAVLCWEFSTSSVGNGGGMGAKSKVPGERRRSARRRQREVLTGCEPWLSSSRRGHPSLAFPSLSCGSSARRGHRALWDRPKHGLTS